MSQNNSIKLKEGAIGKVVRAHFCKSESDIYARAFKGFILAKGDWVICTELGSHSKADFRPRKMKVLTVKGSGWIESGSSPKDFGIKWL